MRIYWIALLVLAPCFSTFAFEDESAQELDRRAESAPADQQIDLYLRAAGIQLKAAKEFYDSGKTEEARQAVNDVVTFSEKTATAASRSGKKLKKAEIELRKMAARLRDIRRTLSFEDQAPVQTAADRLEGLRTELLQRMFSKDKKP